MFTLDPRLAQDGPLLHTPFDDHLVIVKKNAHFPWLVVVPKLPDISELFQLTEAHRNRLFEVVALVSQALKSVTGAHKLNVHSIGNVVAQLHVHLIARSTDDHLWPNPIWREQADGSSWWPGAPDAFIRQIQQQLSETPRPQN